jgi:hypothetical protein
LNLVAILLMHLADVVIQNLAQLERVNPEHGSAEVVAQPHFFKNSVVQRLIFHERVRARQVTCDV